MRHCASIDHQPALQSPDCFNGLCSTASLCSTSQRALTLFVLPACVIDLQSEFLLQTDSRCSPLIRAHLLNECCVCNLAPSLCVSLRNCGLWHAGPNDKYSQGECQHTAMRERESERQRGMHQCNDILYLLRQNCLSIGMFC